MSYQIQPGKYSGKVTVPAAKCMMHRYLLMAALSEGTSYIHNCSYGNEVLATVAALCDMGVQIHRDGDTLIIKGGLQAPQKTLNCYNSATTLHLMIPMAMLLQEEMSFKGAANLMKRPLSEYEPYFQKYELNENVLSVGEYQDTDTFTVDGSISGDVVSGLLLVLPLMEHDSVIVISKPVAEEYYIDMTIEALRRFGVEVIKNDNIITVKGRQKYHSCDVTVEGDYWCGAYWLALGNINSDIQCLGLRSASLQPSKMMVEVIKKAGGNIISSGNGYICYPGHLQGMKIDISGCPDLTMALVVLAMFSEQPWLLTNCEQLKFKESDRLKSTVEVFSLLGCNIASSADGILINGRRKLEEPLKVFCYHDDGIIMAVAMAATMLEQPVTIIDSEKVSRSYPGFFEELERLKVPVVHKGGLR